MTVISNRKIPHEGPLDSPYFFILDAPHTADDTAERAMQGKAGDLFRTALEEVGIPFDSVRIGYLCNYQPVKNDMDRAKGTWQLAEGKAELAAYLKTHQHKVLIPMGHCALDFLLAYPSIEKHRGSVYDYGGTFVLPTYSPHTVLANGSHQVAFLHDLLKAKRIVEHGYTKPTFNFIIDPDARTLMELLPTLLSAPRLWVDIETRRENGDLKCIGFAWSPTDAVCIFKDAPMFDTVVRQLLESPVPKTFHNGYFDTMLLAYHGYDVLAWDYDTMIAQHALQPELPLSLAYCTSLYTDINFYKDDGKDTTDRVPRQRLGRYNCLDVVATCQVERAQRSELDRFSESIFTYEFACIPMAQHFANAGMWVDETRRLELEATITARRDAALNGFVALCMYYDVEPFAVSQSAKVQHFLYKVLELPTKTNADGKVTADEDAIVSLLGTAQRELESRKTEDGRKPWQYKIMALKLILKIRGYDKLLGSYIKVAQSADGRVRGNYTITGTESGRWSASKFWDDTGLNPQTIPRESV